MGAITMAQCSVKGYALVCGDDSAKLTGDFPRCLGETVERKCRAYPCRITYTRMCLDSNMDNARIRLVFRKYASLSMV